jgi:hypothetical protein
MMLMTQRRFNRAVHQGVASFLLLWFRLAIVQSLPMDDRSSHPPHLYTVALRKQKLVFEDTIAITEACLKNEASALLQKRVEISLPSLLKQSSL